MADLIKKESIWKRLTRLFKSGPVVRHKIASGEKFAEPQGTARAYKRELSNLYVHSLASYGQYERMCMSLDSLVYLPGSKRQATLKELIELYPNGEKFIVYAYDHKNKKIVPAYAHHPRSSGFKKTVKVNLDDGSSFICTPDHPCMLRDGTYLDAEKLSANTSLMPFYRREFGGSKDGKSFIGYSSIYTMENQLKSWKGWEPEHRLIAEWVAGRDVKKFEEHIHHKDYNPQNNDPSNLEILDAHTHLAMHGKQATDMWTDPEIRKNLIDGINKAWDNDDGSRRANVARVNRETKTRNNVTYEKICESAEKNNFNIKDVESELKCSASAIFRRLSDAGFDIGYSWEDFVEQKFGVTLKRDISSFTNYWEGRERSQEWKDSRKTQGNAGWRSDLTIDKIIESARKNAFVSKDVCIDLKCQNKILLDRIRREGYTGWSDFKSTLGINHKVVSVEINNIVEVGDITVDGYENYACAGVIVHNSRYADYHEMEHTPEIASALDIYSDETSTKGDKGRVIDIISKNAEIKQILETFFNDVLNIEFNIWSWVRNLCKYGDFLLFVDASDSNGILNLLPIPINEVEREEGYDKNDPFAVRFRWLTQGNAILQNWQVIHFRLLGNDSFLPYGQSVIEPARRIWRQLILIEDAMLVYRIVRSPERRVYYIDVGNVAPDKIDEYMEQVKTRLRRNQIVDPSSGRVDLRYNPLSVDEDYFIPTRGDKSSRIESLPGGQFTGDIDDVQYIQNKLFAALKVPKAYLGYEADIGSKATLSQQDVRFARTIERVQKILIAELNKIAIIHLFLLGYSGSDLVDFEIKMSSPSTIAAQQKLELWRMKFEVAGSAQEGVLDRETIYRQIFEMSDEQIEKIREGKRIDKLEDLAIEAMQLPQEEAPEGTPEGEPGAEELPTSLGGEPGGEPAPEAPEGAPEAAGTPEIAPEGVSMDGPGQLMGEVEGDIDEKRNPGSEGSNSEVAVDKGKNLFSTGENLHTTVYGTKKQTASDPYDKRAQRRLVTRPFSENFDQRMQKMDKRSKDIEKDISESLSIAKKLKKSH